MSSADRYYQGVSGTTQTGPGADACQKQMLDLCFAEARLNPPSGRAVQARLSAMALRTRWPDTSDCQPPRPSVNIARRSRWCPSKLANWYFMIRSRTAKAGSWMVGGHVPSPIEGLDQGAKRVSDGASVKIACGSPCDRLDAMIPTL